MSSGDEKEKGERPEPDHEAIEALLAADPRCEKDDSPDDDDEEGPTTITFLSREAAERLKAQQERREND